MARPTHEQTQRPPGRPRDPETERRILDAALQLLRSDGYTRMSVDAVALAAGASKPTIYRRWPTKADLATAALRTIQLAEPSVNTGTAKGDLIQTLENFRRSLLRPNGLSLIGTVLAEEEHTPELMQRFRERLVKPRRAMLRTILAGAEKRKELRAGVDLDCVVTMLVGAFYARYLAESRVPESFPRTLVETVWRGIAR